MAYSALDCRSLEDAAVEARVELVRGQDELRDAP